MNAGSANDQSFTIGITPEFVDSAAVHTEGLSVSLSDRGDTALYAQPIVDGLRLTSVIAGPEAGGVFAYKFDVPEGTKARPTGRGGYILGAPASDGGEPLYLGSIQPPWALDAVGTQLPTRYEWADGVLTQFVDLEKVSEYPVIADPAWGYGHQVSFGTTSFTEYSAWGELNRCFNCSFPISGAPAYFPPVNEVLPLDASPWTCIFSINAGVRMFDKYFIDGSIMHFRFKAMPGHFDGEGSSIGFSFYNPDWDSYYLNLEILALVLVDNGPVINAINRTAAKAQWGTFAQQLNANMIANGW